MSNEEGKFKFVNFEYGHLKKFRIPANGIIKDASEIKGFVLSAENISGSLEANVKEKALPDDREYFDWPTKTAEVTVSDVILYRTTHLHKCRLYYVEERIIGVHDAGEDNQVYLVVLGKDGEIKQREAFIGEPVIVEKGKMFGIYGMPGEDMGSSTHPYAPYAIHFYTCNWDTLADERKITTILFTTNKEHPIEISVDFNSVGRAIEEAFVWVTLLEVMKDIVSNW